MPINSLTSDDAEQPDAAMIDTDVAAKGFRLQFPPALETMFERETGPNRRQLFTRYGCYSLLVYDLTVLSYFRDLPDVARLTTLVQLLFVTPLCLCAIAYNRRKRSFLAREGIPAAMAVLTLVANVFVLHHSQLPLATLYHYSPIMTIIYINVVVSVRFPVAVWATVIVLAVTALDMATLHVAIPAAKGQIISAIVLAGLMTLLANYRTDKELRHAYLINARERLHRCEIARLAEVEALDHAARRRAADGLEADTLRFSSVASVALDDFAQVSGNMRILAQHLTCASDATAQRAAAMASGAQMASTHVAATAAAIRSLANTTSSVSRDVAGSIEMANGAVEQAGQTTATIMRLSRAADQIGAIVTTIQAIAKRTKLLALNAMIEAARAGDAGRGFSVVAEEVKVLAAQAALATETISNQIGAIELCTAEAVSALQGINATIGHINGVATQVAVVMREQAVATEEISLNVASAACNASEVSGLAGEVQRDAEAAGQVAVSVLGAASAVGERESGLRAHVADFLVGIRAA